MIQIPRTRWCATILLLFATALAGGQATAEGQTERSAAGHFQVGFTSGLQPLGINQMHTWTLHVADAEGAAVEQAIISIAGGMPEHDHGLPSQPRVTRSLGEGKYLVEGMKFHMHGAWEVSLTISTGAISDTVVFRFEL